MNAKKLLSIATLSLSLFVATESKAGFPVKNTAAIEVVNTTAGSSSLTVNDENNTVTPAEATHVKVKKHSLLNRIAHKLAGKDTIPQAAYIILSILALGWLAIGLNDNFEGISWLLSLLLYILFYFPGLIYSLIVMGDYY